MRGWWARLLRHAGAGTRTGLAALPELEQPLFDQVLGEVRGAARLSAAEHARLRERVRQFLAEKEFHGLEGLVLESGHRYAIAIQACLPILYLGIAAYRGWRSIYVFPDTFRERHAQGWQPGRFEPWMDLAGVALHGGGVVLAWAEVEQGMFGGDDGYNPVIHEFAHKLDMLDGEADGRPPLPSGISQQDWFETFSAAFADFEARVDAGEDTPFSDYAAADPAEFFAVLSEVHFEQPEVLAATYPEVARLLHIFYTDDRGSR